MSDPLPVELGYLEEMAMTVGPAWRYWAQEARVERHGKIWRDLAQLHQRVCQREDGPLVMRWLSQERQPGLAGDRQGQVRGLMRLLLALGRAGISPFHQPVLSLVPRAIKRVDADESPSDSGGDRALPAALQRRLRQARALGIAPGWHGLADFVDRVDEARFNRLCTMVHRMKRTGEYRALRSLVAQQRITSSRAAAMAKSLLHVVDALEIF